MRLACHGSPAARLQPGTAVTPLDAVHRGTVRLTLVWPEDRSLSTEGDRTAEPATRLGHSPGNEPAIIAQKMPKGRAYWIRRDGTPSTPRSASSALSRRLPVRSQRS